MSILAGTILHVGGNNIIDRLQSAGLGNAQVPHETIREIGNLNIVDKVPGEPAFTFSMDSLDVSCEIEAWLTGEVGDGTPAGAPSQGDADGTQYLIDGVHPQFVNIVSPWRDPLSSGGNITAGHIIPGFYPTRIVYSFGVTANANETVDFAGSAYYFHDAPPVEHYFTGDGATTAFATPDPAVPYREGGAGGQVFRSIFGVIVDGSLQSKGVDYTTSPTNVATPGVATVTFATPPRAGAVIKAAYFTTAARAFPKTLNSSVLVKPAAVRGRNICVFLGSGGAAVQMGGVQSATLEYNVQGQEERELCNYEVVGYTVLGTDVTGQVVVRPRDMAHFRTLLQEVTGVDPAEVYGWLNTNAVPLSIKIQNPKNTSQILKTLFVSDAIFDVPDTPSRVNQPVDVTMTYSSRTGTYSVFKGDSGF